VAGWFAHSSHPAHCLQPLARRQWLWIGPGQRGFFSMTTFIEKSLSDSDRDSMRFANFEYSIVEDSQPRHSHQTLGRPMGKAAA